MEEFCKFISKDLLKLVNVLNEELANRQKYNFAKFYRYGGGGGGSKVLGSGYL